MSRVNTRYFEDGNSEDPWYDGPGWYFFDEAEQCQGPFDTEKTAEAALKHYVENEL